MAKCCPGDLAVVIRADFPCNVGKVVRVIARDCGTGDIVFGKEFGVVWLVSGTSLMKWFCRGRYYRRRSGPVPDSQLQPIRGTPEPDGREQFLELEGQLCTATSGAEDYRSSWARERGGPHPPTTLQQSGSFPADPKLVTQTNPRLDA